MGHSTTTTGPVTGPSGNDDLRVATTMPSPVGTLILVAGAGGLRAVLWPGQEGRTGGATVIDDLGSTPTGDGSSREVAVGILRRTVEQLTEYFEGTRRDFDLPLDPEGTEFQLATWMALRDIPYGETISYGEQARRLGDVNKARAVGAANGRNPLSIVVPCHRVVGADGSLTGYGGGMDAKSWLLHHERTTLDPGLPLG